MTKKLTQKEKEAFALVGSFGGRATAKKLGKRGMRALGKEGAKKRWGEQKKFETAQGKAAIKRSKGA